MYVHYTDCLKKYVNIFLEIKIIIAAGRVLVVKNKTTSINRVIFFIYIPFYFEVCTLI